MVSRKKNSKIFLKIKKFSKNKNFYTKKPTTLSKKQKVNYKQKGGAPV